MGNPGDLQREMPLFTACTTYFSYFLLFLLGHVRDLWWRLGLPSSQRASEKPRDGYAPICASYEDFYTRRLYKRIHDCWNRPIVSAPDGWIDVIEREPISLVEPGTTRCLNLGSYNYLGFAAADEFCTDRAVASLEKHGVSMCSGWADAGTTPVHASLEQEVAQFVGKPAAIVYGMGYATNSLTLPAMMGLGKEGNGKELGKGVLIVSDALNHNSIVAGARGSAALVRVFRHNDPAHLEKVLREAISGGQPRTHVPWRKIIVLVEGVYSMEGEVCRLAEIVAVKAKYKAYLYLDEAHSIGALGLNGRGCCEQAGVNPADVDILMGTFTKSFGSCGGYVAGSEDFIASLRIYAPAMHAVTMAPAAAEQALSALRVIAGKPGTGTRGEAKLRQLRENSNWFRAALRGIGLEVLGDDDSPVMPIMLYQPSKIAAFSRLCLERNVAVVVVGFPACPLLLSRARICISAAHTRADLERALEVISDVAQQLGLLDQKPGLLASPEPVAVPGAQVAGPTDAAAAEAPPQNGPALTVKALNGKAVKAPTKTT